MRLWGLAFIVALGAGLGAFHLQPRVAASTPTMVPAALSPATPPAASVVPEPPQEAPSVARAAVSAAPTPAPAREGNRRRSRRDVWVGPIPTPADWAPPEGPVRIALQAGHWRASEAPPELSGLKDNGTAAQGTAEWEVNLDIARRSATLLEGLGYVVDVLPAVVPPSYRAHLFISIHADGSGDSRASGFRVAAPRNDATGRAAALAKLLERSYADATGIRRLPTVTRRMQNYYAFNFRRYEHALHPMTIGVILETGFLTSATDRSVIVDDPDRAARGIAAAVTAFSVTPPPGPALVLAAAGVE